MGTALEGVNFSRCHQTPLQAAKQTSGHQLSSSHSEARSRPASDTRPSEAEISSANSGSQRRQGAAPHTLLDPSML